MIRGKLWSCLAELSYSTMDAFNKSDGCRKFTVIIDPFDKQLPIPIDGDRSVDHFIVASMHDFDSIAEQQNCWKNNFNIFVKPYVVMFYLADIFQMDKRLKGIKSL